VSAFATHPKPPGHTPVLIFPIYASIIGVLAMHWRRRWPAFVVVAVGTLIPLFILYLFSHFERQLRPEQHIILELLWPYTALIAVAGLYIACLPRPALPGQCSNCRYELAGLADGASCPECGKPAPAPRPAATEEALIPIPSGPPRRRTSL
jgi:hypothetical protein